jgi:heme/copper-type cytochrome/quinol oxidase subunit 2
MDRASHCDHTTAEHAATQRLTNATYLLVVVTVALVLVTAALTVATFKEKSGSNDEPDGTRHVVQVGPAE